MNRCNTIVVSQVTESCRAIVQMSTRSRSFGKRNYGAAGRHVWNSLPSSHISYVQFKRLLTCPFGIQFITAHRDCLLHSRIIIPQYKLNEQRKRAKISQVRRLEVQYDNGDCSMYLGATTSSKAAAKLDHAAAGSSALITTDRAAAAADTGVMRAATAASLETAVDRRCPVSTCSDVIAGGRRRRRRL